MSVASWSTAKPISPLTLTLSSGVYTFTHLVETGDLSAVYLGSPEDGDNLVALKALKSASDVDLLETEEHTLTHLWEAGTKSDRDHFTKYLPRVIERCTLDLLKKSTPALLLGYHPELEKISTEYVSLQEVLRAYPDGLPVNTVVWMIGRMLEILQWIHQQGVVHGAVLPGNVLIHPKTHGGILLDFCYSVTHGRASGKHIPAVDTAYKDHYPPEVYEKHPAVPAIDLYMVGTLATALLGGKLSSGELPDTVPEGIRRILEVTRLPIKRRPADLWRYYQDFQATLRATFGPRKYHRFIMPA